MTATSDHHLIERAQQGSAEAIGELYQRYVDKMTRYVSYRVSDGTVIEDIIAEIFLNMMEGLSSYVITGAPFEAWLYRIAQARIADFYRERQRHPEEELLETLQSDRMPIEFNIQQAEEFDALRTAIGQLNEEHQTILILRFVERKSHEEVAEILDKNPSAVATAQHRALKRLAELMGTEKDTRHYIRGNKS